MIKVIVTKKVSERFFSIVIVTKKVSERKKIQYSLSLRRCVKDFFPIIIVTKKVSEDFFRKVIVT